MCAEARQSAVIERNNPDRLFSLRGAHHLAATDLHNSLPDVKRSAVEVDVIPAEAYDFTTS
jgi:hypothetical protein